MQHIKPLAVRRSSDEAHSAIRALILEGAFDIDERIEEIPLSVALGVSRTPVREALIRLESEGLAQSRPNHGFTVVLPTEERIRESYSLLGVLEATAVRLAAPELADAIDELKQIVAALARETNKARQYELDHDFHRRLIRDCGNGRLLQIIEAERVRAARFDGGRLRGTFDREGSCRDHLAIVALIEQSNVEAAAQLLEDHWRRGIGIVVSWLEKSR